MTAAAAFTKMKETEDCLLSNTFTAKLNKKFCLTRKNMLHQERQNNELDFKTSTT